MALQGKYGLMVLVAVLLAGAAIGFASTSLAYRLHWIEAPRQTLVDQMTHDLKLDPSQREQVGAVMRHTHDRITAMRVGFQRQRRQLLLDAYLQISAILTPGQRARFDAEFVPPRFREAALRKGRTFNPSANPFAATNAAGAATNPIASPSAP